MSFAGDLEHLPIVDVIQLLHSTRKTGTLYLRSHKGESQLVFNDGYIVSANHVQNNIRIGHILVEMGAITQQQLEQTLHKQSLVAGDERRPLIAMLIEGGQIDRRIAFSGLEALIELTIVEILTWNSGTFALDVDSRVICDEYRYFPETLKQDITLNTQNILMDALRIYDERLRDGTLQQVTFSPEPDEGKKQEPAQEGTVITADILGLDNLDRLEKKIPEVFLGIKEYDAAEIHREKLRGAVSGLTPHEYDRLISLLLEYPDAPPASETRSRTSPLAVIVFTADALMEHLIATVCRHEGIFVFSTNEESNLDMIIDQSFAKELVPILVIDAPTAREGSLSSAAITGLLQQKREKYPQIAVFQLVAPRDGEFSLLALQSGVRGIITRPIGPDQQGAFVESAAKFMKALQSDIRKSCSSADQQIMSRFKECIHELDGLKKIPDVAFRILEFASAMFERTLTFVVGNNELIAEKGFGVSDDKSAGATAPLLFTVPLEQPSVFQDVIRSGRYFYGQCNDTVLRGYLYTQIETPHSPKVLLMPIRAFGRVIALIYGDFGQIAGLPLQIDLLDIAARYAGLILDNNLYRQKLLADSRQK